MQKQEPARQIWLITYGSGCKSIDHEILSAMGLEADECYTVTWRESKYSLIHLPRGNRTRRSNIIKVMQRMKDEHGIISAEIFGFDSIACNTVGTDSSLEDHPGFMRMVTAINENAGELEIWMANGTLTSNRKGLLWKYIAQTEPEKMTRTQLIKRVKEWGPFVRMTEESIQRNALLLDLLQATEAALDDMSRAYENERKSNEQLMKKLLEKMNESSSDGRPTTTRSMP